MKTLLWLDDYRNPFDDDWLPLWAPVKDYTEVVWVKSYDEFVEWITTNGLPYCICFDHDLADEHYHNDMYKGIDEYSKLYSGFNEKTGMDCAKWLVEYCLDHGLGLPPWRVHSANPAGADNIRYYLQNFENSQKPGILHYLDKAKTVRYNPDLERIYHIGINSHNEEE